MIFLLSIRNFSNKLRAIYRNHGDWLILALYCGTMYLKYPKINFSGYKYDGAMHLISFAFKKETSENKLLDSHSQLITILLSEILLIL